MVTLSNTLRQVYMQKCCETTKMMLSTIICDTLKGERPELENSDTK